VTTLDAPAPSSPQVRRSPVRLLLGRASDSAWRLLVVVAALAVVLFVLGRLWFVVMPLFVALLLTAAISPVTTRLEARGAPPVLAAWAGFGGFLAVLVGLGMLIVPAIAEEFDRLGPVLSRGVDDVERWLVDGPLGLEPETLKRYRAEAGDRIGAALRSSSDSLVAGAVAAVEVVAGTILGLVLTFFFLKDGRKFQQWGLDHLPPRHHELVRALAARAWRALGAYLRGAALIGLLEAVVLGLTVWLVGARLAVPVAVLTFIGAFFPIVGAVAAGIVATLVALVSGGPSAALIVAVVALLVQQFDNDLLAPMIYGRMIRLHPVVVLLSLTAGGTLGGVAGAFLAVPVAAVLGAVGQEIWARYGEVWLSAQPTAENG
jgi:putative heme transporter